MSPIRQITDAEAIALTDKWGSDPKAMPAADAKAFLAWMLMKSAKREHAS